MTRDGRGLLRGRIQPGATEALYYSLPYLIFVILPVYSLVKDVEFTWESGATLVLLAVMVGIYVLMWLTNPVAPLGGRGSRHLWIQLSVMALVIASMVALCGPQVPGILFMPTYLLSPWVFLVPRKLVIPGAVTIMVVTLATGFLMGVPRPFIMTVAATMAMSMVVIVVSRIMTERGRKEDVAKEEGFQLGLERERSQMNSDLHDLLGQDLTGLSIKAELADRLVEAGRYDDARAELRDIATLARQSLEDVRAVVRRGREWSVDRELASAADLLAARGISLEVNRADVAFPGPQAGAIARVIREAVTNLLRHSEPARCWIDISARGVTVENDGYSRRSPRHALPGHGLTHLSSTVKAVGALEWGPGGRGWRVKLEVEA